MGGERTKNKQTKNGVRVAHVNGCDQRREETVRLLVVSFKQFIISSQIDFMEGERGVRGNAGVDVGGTPSGHARVSSPRVIDVGISIGIGAVTAAIIEASRVSLAGSLDEKCYCGGFRRGRGWERRKERVLSETRDERRRDAGREEVDAIQHVIGSLLS